MSNVQWWLVGGIAVLLVVAYIADVFEKRRIKREFDREVKRWRDRFNSGR